MSGIEELNKHFNNGILPDELNFSIKREYFLDLNKIKYNAFYRSYEFYENKFPKGYESIPGFDKIIDSIVCKAKETKKTPLDELEELEKELEEIEKEKEINNIE